MTYILIIIIIILIIDKILNKRNDQNEPTEIKKTYKNIYNRKKYLLTQQELKFYKLIKNITDKYNLILFSQVTLYEIVTSKNIKDFNKIKSKTIDFVITDINTQIKLCIELDDTTHIKENRQERDKFIEELFKELDIKLIRIPVQSYYNLKDIEEKIKGTI